jgi:hypothetical protein
MASADPGGAGAGGQGEAHRAVDHAVGERQDEVHRQPDERDGAVGRLQPVRAEHERREHPERRDRRRPKRVGGERLHEGEDHAGPDAGPGALPHQSSEHRDVLVLDGGVVKPMRHGRR